MQPCCCLLVQIGFFHRLQTSVALSRLPLRYHINVSCNMISHHRRGLHGIASHSGVGTEKAVNRLTCRSVGGRLGLRFCSGSTLLCTLGQSHSLVGLNPQNSVLTVKSSDEVLWVAGHPFWGWSGLRISGVVALLKRHMLGGLPCSIMFSGCVECFHEDARGVIRFFLLR